MRKTMVEAIAVELAEHFDDLKDCGEGVAAGASDVKFLEHTVDAVSSVQHDKGFDQVFNPSATLKVDIGGMTYTVTVRELGAAGSQ